MTRRDLFRRRIAPVLFGIAIALMARKSCQGESRTHATYVLNFGASEPNVKTVDAEMWMDNEQIRFPLTTLPLAIIQNDVEGQPFFTNRLMWMGFGVAEMGMLRCRRIVYIRLYRLRLNHPHLRILPHLRQHQDDHQYQSLSHPSKHSPTSPPTSAH